MKRNVLTEKELFFSKTLPFLQEYLPVQLCRSPETVESYTDSLTLFRRYLWDVHRISVSSFRFADCTRNIALGFRNYLLGSGSSPATVNVRMTALRSYLQYAADMDISIQSAAITISRIPPCKVTERVKETLSPAALETIFRMPPENDRGLRDRTLLILLYDSAVRLQEILSIRLCDLHLDGEYPTILIHGKGRKERFVVLSDKTAHHIRSYTKVFHPASVPEDYLFYTVIKGKRDKMSSGNVQRMINRYADMAREFCPGLPERVHPHMFRRTRATDLYQNGVALEMVSTFLGHAQLETTRIYAKPSMEQMKTALESTAYPGGEEKALWEGDEDAMARLCGLR